MNHMTTNDLTPSALLAILKASCEEALDGTWDRSDDGFEAMITIIEKLEALLADH